MQTSYGPPKALTNRGEIVSKEKRIRSAPAKEILLFGSIAAFIGTSLLGIQNPSPDQITFNTGLGASNVISGTVIVKTIDENGAEVFTKTSIAPVTYSGSHSATMGLIRDAIQQINSKLTATISTNTITVTHSEQAVVILSLWGVSGGSAVNVNYSFSGTILGPIQRQPVEQSVPGATAAIKPGMMVSAMTQGIMTIYSVHAMNLGSALYAQFIENGSVKRGEIRTSTDSGNAQSFSPLKPNSTVSANTLGNVEINTP